jgi:hypothetical protein
MENSHATPTRKPIPARECGGDGIVEGRNLGELAAIKGFGTARVGVPENSEALFSVHGEPGCFWSLELGIHILT